MRVSVVILNWNGRFFLEKFLPSVLKSTYPDLEIIVGDNGSVDGSVAFVRENHPGVKIMENGRNLGFAGGYNAVLERVEADCYVLLNSDVEVHPNWIEPVVAYLESHPDIAAAQPKIRSQREKNKFEHAGAAGGFMDRYGYPFCRGRLFHEVEEDKGQYDDPVEIFWATGAALFIRSEAWKAAGGFDVDFFAHMEEIDLCWRLKRMGHGIACVPTSTVYHVGGGTLEAENPRKTFLNFRNNLMMLQKNLPPASACWVVFARFWLDWLAFAKFLAEGRAKNALAVCQAWLSFFRNMFKTAKKRRVYTAKANETGLYKGLIVFDFFVKGIRRLGDLKM